MIPDEYRERVDEIRSDIMEKVAEGPSELVNYISFSLINNGFDEKDCDDFIKKAFILYSNSGAESKKEGSFKEISEGAKVVRGAVGGTAGTIRDVKDIATVLAPFTPFGRQTFGQKITSAIGRHLPLAIGSAVLGAFGAKKLLEKSKEKAMSSTAFAQILEEKPELANDPNIEKYYQTITRFAPALASDKHILESALEHAHEYGRLDYPMMKELIEMQTKIDPRQPYFQTAKTVSSIGSVI